MSFDGHHVMKYKDFCGYLVESHRFMHKEERDDLFVSDDMFFDSENCVDSQTVDSEYYDQQDQFSNDSESGQKFDSKLLMD